MAKDLGLALDAADDDLALTRAALAAARDALAAGHAGDDYAALAGYVGYEGHADSV
jgi:3-hydroxyisobutyrate dehydrogenase-like beta-hydroxyacid dehydrogenase